MPDRKPRPKPAPEPTPPAGDASAPRPAAFLVKGDPEDYGFPDLVREKRTAWTGVRNPVARKVLSQMRQGDRVLVYHTGDEKRVVGRAEVVREAYADPTAKEGDWLCVDLEARAPLKTPVTLAQVKADPSLASMPLVRQGRLSVQPVTEAELSRILTLAGEA